MATYQVVYQLRVIQNGRVVNRKHLSGLGKSDAALVKAQAGQLFVIADTLGIQNAPQVRMKRVGQNLYLALENGNPDIPDLIIEGYFNFASQPIMGAASDGAFIPYSMAGLTSESPTTPAPSELASAATVQPAAPASAAPVSAASTPAQSAVVTSRIADSSEFSGLQQVAMVGAGLLGLGALGSKGGGGATDLLLIFKTYADDGSKAAPTLDDYKTLGVTGVNEKNLAAINSAIDALNGTQVDSKAKVQAVIDAYVKILAEANGPSADATPTVNPTVADYLAIGVNIGQAATQASALGLLNDVVGGLLTTDVDTVAKLNALATVTNKIMSLAGGSFVDISLAELALIGVPTTGIGALTAQNLPIVLAAIAAAGGQASVDTMLEINGLVSAVSVLQTYAADGSSTAPNLSHYAAFGVTGVTANNLAAINSAIDAQNPAQVDSKIKVQAIVDAYVKILAEANGSAADATPANPTIQDYQLIGVNLGAIATQPAALNLYNDVIGSLTTTAVDSIAELNALAAIVVKIMTIADGGTANLSVADLNLIGIATAGSGAVTSSNLPAIINAIKTAGGQSNVDTLPELSGLITGISVVMNYAGDSNQALPTLSQYSGLGITGVNANNLAAINSAIDALAPSQVDSKPKVQAVVDAYLKILAEANGAAADATPGSNPTIADYAAIGANIGLANTNPAALNLLNEVIGNLTSTGVDTIAEINALAAAVAKVIQTANGQASGLSIDDLFLLGLPSSGAGAITTANFAAVLAAIANAGGQNGVDTFKEFSGLATAVATIFTYSDDSTQTAPTLAQYQALGITGITAGNVDAINSAIDASSSSQVDTKAKIQAITDAYLAILAEANGSASDLTPGVNPTAAQFALIGANIGAAANNSTNLALLDDSIANLTTTAVDTIAEINALAAAANAVISAAAGGTPVSLAQLQLLGVAGLSGLSLEGLNAIQAAIAATSDDGTQVDTIAELNALVSKTLGNVASSNIIKAYADDNTALAPTANDYTAVGVTGVNSSNLSAINSAVDALVSADVDTSPELQAIVNAYVKILAEANGLAPDATPGVNPSANDFRLVGANIGRSAQGFAGGTDLASNSLNLLDDSISGLTSTSVNSVSKLNALAAIIDKIMDLAQLPTGAAIPTSAVSMAELASLGLNVSLVNTAAETNAIWQAIINSSDDGSGITTIAALQNIINANAS